jgi:NTP pyrophosphatase (non-canonical NTP hydrolase)
MKKQQVIMERIDTERKRQERMWGQQDHSPAVWLSILAEEFGEVAKALNENDPSGYKGELIQVAAVAVAMIESVQRNGWVNSFVDDDGTAGQFVTLV